MTERDRADLLASLGELWRRCPEMRFGQLIANLAVVAHGTDPGAIWDMEDADLLNAVKGQSANLDDRTTEVA